MKVGLVLEGGAMRGLYTAGVLDVFMENDIKIDTIIGVSAGALFGINYKSKQKGRVLRYNKKYLNDKRYMGLYSLMTTGNIMNKKFCFGDLIYKLDKFDFDEYKKSDVNFFATVTNIETGKAEYINIDDIENNFEYLRASGSMPLVSRIVKIGGKKYLDGGIADSIPYKKAFDFGCDKVIVVLTRPIEYRKKQTNMKPYNIVYRHYPNFLETVKNRYIDYNDTLEQIKEEEKKNNIFVIRPSRDTGIKRIEKDVTKLDEMYNLGVEDTKANLIKLKEYLNI